MKGKSLRGIVILAFVVCALLAVATDAFAKAWYWDGTMLGERISLSWSQYSGNVASAHEYVIRADFTPQGNGALYADGGLYVQRIPEYANYAQTIRSTIWLQRYNGQSLVNVASQKDDQFTTPNNEYGGMWYRFKPPSFLFATGYYYRLRVFTEWYATYGGARLGWKWIGFRSYNYWCNTQASSFANYILHNDYYSQGEGWVYYPQPVSNTGDTWVIYPPSL